MKETVICSVCGRKQALPVFSPAMLKECTIFPEFCPDSEVLVEKEINGIIQSCKKCGYTFPRIDERGIDMPKKLVESEEYRYPFGLDFKGREEAVTCFRVASAYRQSECSRFAAKWYIYSAVLLEDRPEERKRCLRNAWCMLLQAKAAVRYRKRGNDFEVELAELNVKRMLGLFREVTETAGKEKSGYNGIERQLLEALACLAEKEDDSYMTYMCMLLQEVKN